MHCSHFFTFILYLELYCNFSCAQASDPTEKCDKTWSKSCNKKSTQVFDQKAVENFRKQVLAAHNTYRTCHGAEPLIYNGTLEKTAEQWVAKLVSGSEGHSHYVGIGENIFWQFSTCPNKEFFDGTKPVSSWYDEIKDYSYRNPRFSPATGHFTQVVWTDTKSIGVGVRVFESCINGIDGTKLVVVAQYYPPGNYIGQFQKKVLPKKC